MKTYHRYSTKILSFVLAITIVVVALPGTVLASGTDNMSECHPVHDENCGYIAMAKGVPCSHLSGDGTYSCAPTDANEEYTCVHHDECRFAEAAEGVPCSHSCELCEVKGESETQNSSEAKTSLTTPECTCMVKCVTANEKTGTEAAMNAACPVCEIDNANLSKCTGKNPVMLAAPKTIAKRMICLDLRFHTDAPLDKDGNTLTSEDGIFDMLDTEGWKWDSNTLTLTLNGANIETTGYNHALELPENKGDVTIVLEGENALVSEGWDALAAWSNLTIDGRGGRLNANCKQYAAIAVTGNLTITGGTFNVGSLDGGANTKAIRANGNINISGGNITAKSNLSAIGTAKNVVIDNTKVTSKSSAENAIFAGGKLIIQNNADITAESFWPPLFSQGDMSIAGSVVNATSNNYAAINSEGNIVFTDSTVTAKSILSDYTAIYTGKTITIGGSSKVLAKGDFRGIHGNTAVLIHDIAHVEAIGENNDGIYSQDVQISGNAVVKATGRGNQGAITGIANLSITGDAEVDAIGDAYGIYAKALLILSGKNIIAYGENDNAVFSSGDITIGGKLAATSNAYFAVKSGKTITADNKADITAIGSYSGGGIQAEGDINLNGSTVEASATEDDGIYSGGTIKINGGSVHAKGGEGYVAIRAKNVQTADEAVVSKIALTNLLEKNGGKVAFSDWNGFNGDSTSWTSFVSKDTAALEVDVNGDISNGLLEVWLTAPYNNGGENDNGSNGNADSPQTGDNSLVLLFVLMILASGVAPVILAHKRRKFRHCKK